MQRILVLVAGLGLLPAAAGCHHTAGFCDCAPIVNPCCYYGLYPTAPAVEAAPAVHEPPLAPPVREVLGAPREGL